MSAPLPSFSLAPREPIEVELARKLIAYLSSSGLKPGDKLPSERRMAESLGVGRAALRHAIKSLSILGAVEVRPSSGTYLRDEGTALMPQVIEWGLLLGGNKVEHVIEARSSIEVALAGFAAARRTDADIERLQKAIAMMEESTADQVAYVSRDVDFHMALAQAARSDVLAGVLRSTQSLLHSWATQVIEAAGETSSSLAMHTPVVDAIVAGDVELAQETMGALMHRAGRRLQAAIAASK